MKKSYDYVLAFSEEKPCMGGIGSKPAFEILADMNPDVVVKREYTIYKGQVGFSVHGINRSCMQAALWKLHRGGYNWIDGNDAEARYLDKLTHEVDI